MGGARERMIRSIRKILNILIGSQSLNDEEFITIVTEVEAILNSRPLMGQEPLTPNHLLFLRGTPNLFPGLFDKKHCCTRRRWDQIPYINSQLWCRLIKQFLSNLSQSQK